MNYSDEELASAVLEHRRRQIAMYLKGEINVKDLSTENLEFISANTTHLCDDVAVDFSELSISQLDHLKENGCLPGCEPQTNKWNTINSPELDNIING